MVQAALIEEFQKLSLAERLRLIDHLLQLVLAEVGDEGGDEGGHLAGSSLAGAVTGLVGAGVLAAPVGLDYRVPSRMPI